MQVKNTFIHVDTGDEEFQPPLRRVVSSPDMLQSIFEKVSDTESVGTSESTKTSDSIDGDAEFLLAEPMSLEQKEQSHNAGLCKPCSYFFFKPDGCRKGDHCQFCHLCTLQQVKEKKRELKKEARFQKRTVRCVAKYEPGLIDRTQPTMIHRPGILTPIK